MRTQPIMAALFAASVIGFGLAGAVKADSDITVLAGTCYNCHGTEGRSPGSIPSIAGQPYAVLLAQLQAFKAGEARNATVMSRLATGYTDEELEALARYFSEQ
ncbi:c-type cytochrome [Pelagibacterium limicola]|uniref:c-type cytochrome n=1 Tax=Pelagibacterium limicola TaxID=2791022 RepID=UPI0018AF7A18|nr:c-type cytochrome [Pelagibacterium limicola]